MIQPSKASESRQKKTSLSAKAVITGLLLLYIPWILFNIAMVHSCAADQSKQPQQHPHIQHNVLTNNKKTLVVYAGPNSKSSKLAELYKKNLEYFLKHGVDCATQDTVIVVGQDFYNEYRPWIQKLKALDTNCQSRHSSIMIISRRNVCYDMEAARLALYGGAPGLDVISSYDYFFFINCGTTGPYWRPRNKLGKKVLPSSSSSWTSHFTKLLNDKVKMTGLSLNCLQVNNPHIQSMMYALDKVGLDLVMKSGAFYDCLDPPNKDFINKYERKMGHAIVDAGFAIQPLVGRGGGKDGNNGFVLTTENKKECVPCDDNKRKELTNETEIRSCKIRDYYRDFLMESRLTSLYDGKVPSLELLEEMIFMKTSRVLPVDVAKEINYTGKIDWTWH